MFREWRFSREWKRRQRLSPEELQAEDTLLVRNDLLSAEMLLGQLAGRVEGEKARAWLEERQETVSKIRQEIDALLPN